MNEEFFLLFDFTFHCSSTTLRAAFEPNFHLQKNFGPKLFPIENWYSFYENAYLGSGAINLRISAPMKVDMPLRLGPAANFANPHSKMQTSLKRLSKNSESVTEIARITNYPLFPIH